MAPSHPPQDNARAARPPPIIEHAGEILRRYDVLLCDVWGVVHNGLRAYENACAALTRYRGEGGTVVLVSNAPVPPHRVAAMLDMRKVPESAWDDIVSSGDIALRHVTEREFRKLYCIGPQDRDAALFKELNAEFVALEDADAIICTGLNDDRREKPDDYAPLLQRALRLKLPFVCANPDFIVDVGGALLYCAGAIADLYAHMGGRVYWAGKPYAVAYETAHRRAEALRGAAVERSKCLVIGDAVRTDLKGAENFGCDALFIGSGIHRDETMNGLMLSDDKLAALFKPGAPPAIAAMTELRW